MTEKELQAIRARAEAATEGPWRANCYGILGGQERVLWPTDIGTVESFDKNILFILEARQDVPKLLAEVERLQHALQTYREYGSLFIADMHNGFSLTDLVETKLSEEACGNDEE
ncbi:hypothetical protein NGI46_08155 [Peribacillus butanolivorans]|uniref:hypothetical protein n=1 Tax=Peribacillus butanolivorans TaxID=421767 RepID=UPI00207C4FDA|nr:hypothetical protein [Peribacillus butanolivorans]MCO0597440.1 hypothetical protein [Peribacillus butanolivorans]